MSLRENVLTLVDELWTEAEQAAARRSRVEARVRRDDANRILLILGKPERKWTPPPELPTSWQLAQGGSAGGPSTVAAAAEGSSAG